MLSGIILLIVLYLIGNQLSRIDGAILLSLFAINFYRMFKKREKYKKELKSEISREKGILNAFIFTGSLLALFLSSKYLVQYSHLLAIDFNVPEIIVGLFLISIATTLPELIFGINAVRMGHKEMAIGDQSGTVFTNICLVLGLVAVIHPITSDIIPFVISGLFMALSATMFVTFIKSGRKLTLYEGVILIMLYLIFIIIQFFVGGCI